MTMMNCSLNDILEQKKTFFEKPEKNSRFCPSCRLNNWIELD